MLKDKIDLDYGYTMPDIQQDTIRQTVSYNWNNIWKRLFQSYTILRMESYELYF